MIKVYHAPQSRSVRVIWLLEELGIAYETEKISFTPESMKSPAYKKIHPFGRVPAIQDGEVTMFESGAIVEYLLERYGNGRLAPAAGTPARATYLQWLHFGEATLIPPLSDVVQHTFLRPEGERLAAVAADARKRAGEILAALETAFDGRRYVAGEDFTAADVMVGYGLVLAQLMGLIGDAHPTLQAYLGRLTQRPAFQVAAAP